MTTERAEPEVMRGVKIKLIKGQRGGYGWEISISEATGMDVEVLERVVALDADLNRKYNTL